MLAEPITTLTDYALALEAWIFAGMILSRNPQAWLWAVAFVGVAIAALCGGTYHGFSNVLPIAAQVGLWRSMTVALALASGSMLAAVVRQLPRRAWVWGWGAIGIKTVLYLEWTARNPNFFYIVLDYLLAMIIVLTVQFGVRGRSPSSAYWIILGVLGSFLAAAIQGFRIRLGVSLQPSDLYHLAQMVALYFLYRGACILNYIGSEKTT
jgi:hypothetical protein